MPTMKDIREQYPEYNDLSDGALAAKLHKAFYADMPFNDFSQKISLTEKPQEEGLWEGFVKPTLKAIPKVAGATAGSIVSMPIAGVAGLSRLATTGSLDEANKTVEGVSSIPQQLLDTPAEQQGMENIGLAMKPFQMAGEGWGQIGRATGIPYAEPILGSIGEASAIFGLPALGGKVRSGFKNLDQLREALSNKPVDMPPVPLEPMRGPSVTPLPRGDSITEGVLQMGNAEGAIPQPLPRKTMEAESAQQMGGVSSLPPESTLYGGIPGIAQMADVGKWIANTTPARKLAAFFNPESTVPQGKEWMYSRQKAKGMTALGEKLAESFVQKYKGIKPEDRQLIWEQMNSGADVSTLPKELQTAAREFRVLDNSLGKMLVDSGLMSEETYLANMGNHIRYIYNIHQGGGDLVGSMGQKLDTKFIKSRKDMTDVERQQLGLIKDPVQAIANSIADTYRAVGMANHFQTIANNPNWIFEPTAITIEGKKMGIGKVQKMLDAYDGVEKSGQALNDTQIAYRSTLRNALKDAQAVKVPKDYIPLNGSQYGALDGQYVRKAIAQDIKPILDVFKSSSETANKVVSGIVMANGLWKMKNVALNIPTAARNTISNPIQLLMSGMRPDHVVTRTGQAIVDIAKGGKYYDEALKQGLFKTNFTTGELQDIMNVARNFDQNNWTGFISQVQQLGKYYGKIDDVFKLAKFIDERGMGKAANEAAYQANKWGMDYSFTHPALKILRNSPIGAPFISYQYKIAPLIVESMMKRPWVGASIMSLPILLQKAVTENMTDDDAKRYIESLPEYVKNKQVFLIPGIHGMNALDVSYMVPWGNWFQVADSVKDGKVSKAFKQMGVASGLLPSVMYGVTTGKDLFTGNDIVSPLEKYDPKATAWAITKWIWAQAAPPMLTENSVAGKVSEHLQHGQTSKGLKTEGMNVWPRIGGVNIYPVDPSGKVKGDRFEIQNVRKALMRKMFDRNLSPEERRGATEAYRMAVQSIRPSPANPTTDDTNIDEGL